MMYPLSFVQLTNFGYRGKAPITEITQSFFLLLVQAAVFLIVFIFQLLLTVVVFPISGLYGMKALRRSVLAGDRLKKIKFYYSNIFSLWIPVVVILLLILLTDSGFKDIGFRQVDFAANHVSSWILYPGVGLYFLHLVYDMYLIYIISSNKQTRLKVAKTIPDDLKPLLPVTQKEKRTWTLVSVTAGITEEIVYRGYLFYAFAVIFPGLSLIPILLLTTVIFGIGHIYLGKDGIRSAFLGLLFGIYYILFNSIYPIIIIHIVQDLMARNILEEDGQ